MTYQHKIVLFIAVIVLAAGGVAAWRWWPRRSADQAPPVIEAVRERPAIPVPAVPFRDATAEANIQFQHFNGAYGLKLLPETMGPGVCVLDYDNDGWQDILLINGCPWPGQDWPNGSPQPCLKLYRNTGNGRFTDVTQAAGLQTFQFYGLGACAGDFDNDGYIDLFVTGVGGCHLFHNVAGNGGQRRFEEVATRMGLPPSGGWPSSATAGSFDKHAEPIEFATSATFVDYDRDGWLDLFLCRYVTWSPAIDLAIDSTLTGIGRAYLQPQQFEGSQCALYRNHGGKRFEDVSEAAGVTVYEREGTDATARRRSVAKALGVVVCDPDEDGWPDLLVANDTVRNFFFHNVADGQGGRRYVEKGQEAGAAYAEARARGAMGIDWGEYLPGRRGAVIANFANEPITFLTVADRQRPRFIDSALAVGLAGPSRFWLKFGIFFWDYDLDGRLDLLVCNGHLEPEISKVQAQQSYAQPVLLFWNTGDPQRLWEPVTAAAAGSELFQPLVGRGCAYLDYDGDGDLDVLLVANNGPVRLLRNEQKLGHRWLRLTLEGDGVTSNRSAIGAVITVEAGGQVYQREVQGGRSYLSQCELPVTIGLGQLAADQVEKVTVRWPASPGAPPQVWQHLKVNTAYRLRQGQSQAEILCELGLP
ncbi:MAG: CRTAC1 family protein [Thermogemmata sp.]